MKEEVLLTSPLEYTNEPYAIAKNSGTEDVRKLQPAVRHKLHRRNADKPVRAERQFPSGKQPCAAGNDTQDPPGQVPERRRLGGCAQGHQPASGGRRKRKQLGTGNSGQAGQIRNHAGSRDPVGTGKPLREFLWSEEMADASVHVLLNVDFKDTYKEGDKEIRNCHINVGTGKELSIKEVAEKIMKEINFKGELRWDASKPDEPCGS